jgi:hypothetical protein
MFHRLLKAYKQEGFEIHIGNNHCLCAALTKNGNFAHTGGGISLTDVSFFFGLQKIHDPLKRKPQCFSLWMNFHSARHTMV